MRLLVLGAGLQGSACAYDLLQNPEVEQVRLADISIEHVRDFLAPYSGKRLIPTPLDVRDVDAVRALMTEADAVMSAIPYYFNLQLASHAVDCKAHFCDLGGNTQIVFEQKELDPAARRNDVSVVPDCGLAPGMVNILAEHGIRQLDRVSRVRIYVGGLPQKPEPPLNYMVVYSLEGTLDYYTSLSWILRDGKRMEVEALSEREPVDFPDPIGRLEAFHTAGGLSTMPFRYEGKIPSMEYKTLRYPGHAEIMHTIREIGLLDPEPIDVKGVRVAPRDVAAAAMAPKLTRPGAHDLVALRVVVEGEQGGKPAKRTYEMVDRYDAELGISAMMRTTGYSLSITGQMQASGQIPAGVHTPDEAIPGDAYIAELAKRGIDIKQGG